ncbi:hypothetical protein [uncultured Thioclava sp.]|uniref:hypothetical protein n=1 Tax=uncultured Thioclava sp. TaxID=473858 RepID=UPI0025F95D39|nr:hypothetical protein [uncultured Thioclava sp.]
MSPRDGPRRIAHCRSTRPEAGAADAWGQKEALEGEVAISASEFIEIDGHDGQGSLMALLNAPGFALTEANFPLRCRKFTVIWEMVRLRHPWHLQATQMMIAAPAGS